MTTDRDFELSVHCNRSTVDPRYTLSLRVRGTMSSTPEAIGASVVATATVDREWVAGAGPGPWRLQVNWSGLGDTAPGVALAFATGLAALVARAELVLAGQTDLAAVPK